MELTRAEEEKKILLDYCFYITSKIVFPLLQCIRKRTNSFLHQKHIYFWKNKPHSWEMKPGKTRVSQTFLFYISVARYKNVKKNKI